MLLAVVLAACFRSPAQDALQASVETPQDLAQLSLEQLGNVEVTTVSKEREPVHETPAAVFVITSEDIKRSGATSIPEALRLAPGVEVARIDADHWSVAIRGFSGPFSKSLLVLIDGRSVYSLLHSGVYWDAQNVMLDDVDRIEVVRGPGGTIWGANAVNGVINIITKSAKDTQGVLSTLGGGNVDQGLGAVREGLTAGANFSYRFYGMGGMRGPEYHSDGDNYDHWRLGQVGFRADWKSGQRDSYTVQGDVYRGQSQGSAYIASFSPLGEVSDSGVAEIAGGNVIARWQRTLSEGSDIQVQAYFDRTNRTDFELGETRNTFDFDYIEHARVAGDQNLTWGVGARLSPDRFIQTTRGVNFLPASQLDSIYSGFFQYDLPVVRGKLGLTAGSKLEHNNFSGFDYQPSLRLLWTPTERQSFWASATRAVRTPSRIDQDIVFTIVAVTAPTPIFFQITGNPKFRAEKLFSYETGYRAQWTSRVYLDWVAFYNVYKDLEGYGPYTVVTVTDPPPLDDVFVLPYENVVEGRTVGTEVAPNWMVSSWWKLRGSYSLLHWDLKDRPGYTDVGNLLMNYTGASPAHQANVQSIVKLPGHVEFDQAYRFVDALPAYSVHTYNTVDGRLDWRPGKGFDLSCSGQNLLRPSHPEFGGNPGPLAGIKRSVIASITWSPQ